MNMTRRSVVLLGASTIAMAARTVEKTQPREPSKDMVRLDQAGRLVTIRYERPVLQQGATGASAIPYGKLWPIGAGEPAAFTTNDYTIMPGPVEVYPGTYSLFLIAAPDRWTLVIRHVSGRPGNLSTNESQEDEARIPMEIRKASSPRRILTIRLTPQATNGGQLAIAWGAFEAFTTFTLL